MCSVLLEVSYTPRYTSLPLRQALAEKCDKVCGGGGGKVGGVLGCLLRLRFRTYVLMAAKELGTPHCILVELRGSTHSGQGTGIL